jgi:hypothetical protein
MSGGAQDPTKKIRQAYLTEAHASSAYVIEEVEYGLRSLSLE